MVSTTQKMNVALDSIFPSSEASIAEKMISDFRASFIDVNKEEYSFISPSDITYIEILAFSSRLYDWYFAMRFLIVNLLLPTVSSSYIEPWAVIKGVTRKENTPAIGWISLLAESGGLVIPSGSEFTSLDNAVYTSLDIATSSSVSYSASTISIIGNSVILGLTLTGGATDHGFYSGLAVTIAGSVNPSYNGVKTITVIDAQTIKFDVPIAGLTEPVPSAISVSTILAKVKVQSEEYTEDRNKSSGAVLILSNNITGIEESGRVWYSGIIGGGSTETDAEFRDKVVSKFSSVYTRFNKNDVKDLILDEYSSLYPVITVRQGYPDPAFATIYVSKNGNTSAQRTVAGGDLSTIETFINALAPIGTAPNGIEVINHTYTTINVSVTGFLPNNASLISAVASNIQSYFSSLSVGESVDTDTLRGVITTSTNLEGLSPTAYTLSTPSSLTSISTYAIGCLGTLSVTA